MYVKEVCRDLQNNCLRATGLLTIINRIVRCISDQTVYSQEFSLDHTALRLYAGVIMPRFENVREDFADTKVDDRRTVSFAS